MNPSDDGVEEEVLLLVFVLVLVLGVVVAVCVVSVVKNMARGKQRRSAQRRESGLGDSIFSRILFVYLNLLVFF